MFSVSDSVTFVHPKESFSLNESLPRGRHCIRSSVGRKSWELARDLLVCYGVCSRIYISLALIYLFRLCWQLNVPGRCCREHFASEFGIMEMCVWRARGELQAAPTAMASPILQVPPMHSDKYLIRSRCSKNTRGFIWIIWSFGSMDCWRQQSSVWHWLPTPVEQLSHPLTGSRVTDLRSCEMMSHHAPDGAVVCSGS